MGLDVTSYFGELDVGHYFFGVYIVGFLIYGLYKYFFEKLLEKKREKYGARFKFFELLDGKFAQELITDQSDIEMLKSAIEREAGTVYSLAPLLEDYLVHLTVNQGREPNDKTLSERYQTIKKIIAKENEDKPFAGIPEEERRLLIGMADAIKHEDKESTEFNLNELCNVISARTKDYEQAMKTNRWAVPLAVFSLIASFAFGVISL